MFELGHRLRKQILLQNAQNFSDAPSLRRAAARFVRRVGVENFGNLPDAGLREMRFEAGKNFVDALFGFVPVRMNFPISVDKRADQPSPNRALMIRRIAFGRRARIDRALARIVWTKRAQTERRE